MPVSVGPPAGRPACPTNATNATPRLDAYGVDTVALAALGPAFQDADYFAQRQFLRGLAAAALSNNPTLVLAAGGASPGHRLGHPRAQPAIPVSEWHTRLFSRHPLLEQASFFNLAV